MRKSESKSSRPAHNWEKQDVSQVKYLASEKGGKSRSGWEPKAPSSQRHALSSQQRRLSSLWTRNVLGEQRDMLPGWVCKQMIILTLDV